ncbi:MAG: tetratricopeptide repeat protein, partial [Chloroflexota bacterium]|nr:tetratricopeptide repeat protein [Chloroflexota bacterium]
MPVILLAVFSGAQRCQAQPTPSLEPLTAPAALAVVRAVHLSGDYKQAIRLYQQVQSQAPQSEAAVEALYRQGQAAFAAGDTATTIHSSLQLVIHPRAGRWQAPGLLLLGHA